MDKKICSGTLSNFPKVTQQERGAELGIRTKGEPRVPVCNVGSLGSSLTSGYTEMHVSVEINHFTRDFKKIFPRFKSDRICSLPGR